MRQRYLASRWGMNDPQLNLAAAKAGGDERASFFWRFATDADEMISVSMHEFEFFAF